MAKEKNRPINTSGKVETNEGERPSIVSKPPKKKIDSSKELVRDKRMY